MPQYLYLLKPTRIEMVTQGRTPKEEEIIARHFSYHEALTKKGVMILAGRTETYDESRFGIVILEAENEPAARRIMEADPAVAGGVMQGTLYPYRISLMRRAGRIDLKLVLLYSLLAGIIAALTSPIPGTSLLLTGLEVFMLVHLARKTNFDLRLREIGFAAATLWGVSTILKDTGLELVRFMPGLGWAATVIVSVMFVFFLGSLANLYFSR